MTKGRMSRGKGRRTMGHSDVEERGGRWKEGGEEESKGRGGLKRENKGRVDREGVGKRKRTVWKRILRKGRKREGEKEEKEGKSRKKEQQLRYGGLSRWRTMGVWMERDCGSEGQ